MPEKDEWKATAFCFDREANYSVAWEGDRVEVNHDAASGHITVEVEDGNTRRAYFVIPAALLERPKNGPTRIATNRTPAEVPAAKPAKATKPQQDDFDFG